MEGQTAHLKGQASTLSQQPHRDRRVTLGLRGAARQQVHQSGDAPVVVDLLARSWKLAQGGAGRGGGGLQDGAPHLGPPAPGRLHQLYQGGHPPGGRDSLCRFKRWHDLRSQS